MKTKNILSLYLVAFSIIPTLLVTLILVIFFNSRTSSLVQENVRSTAYWQADNIDNFFSSTKQGLINLSTLAHPDQFLAMYKKADGNTLSEDENQQYEVMTEKITDAFTSWADSQTNVNRVSLVDENNIVVASSKQSVIGSLSQLEGIYIDKLREGQDIVSRIYYDSYESNAPCFIIALPIRTGETLRGFIMMSMNLDYIKTNLSDLNFFDEGAVVVVDGDNVIAADNGFHEMDTHEYNALCTRIMRNGEAQGSFKFKYMRKSRIVCYYRLQSSNWKVISYIDPGKFNIGGGVVLAISLLIGSVFLLITFMLQWLLVKIFNRPLDKLLSFMHELNAGDYTTRIPYLGKNEFSDIAQAFNNLMNRIQADNRELSIKEERYRIANEQSNSIIFEYNVENGTMTCSPNACEFAAYPSFTANFPEGFIENGVIHDGDVATFMRLVHGMTHGHRHGAMEIRMKTYRGEYHWFDLSLTTITDTDTFKPLRIIGKMTDIDEEKRITENLTFKAERDPLTSIYNKAATQTIITQRIADRKPNLYYAFMVLDVDCFKNVNDGYGHQKGDAVLVELSNTLMAQIRGEDVVGRIGGDEFMVLLTEMPSKEAIERKANSLLEAIRKIALDKEKGIYISSSMGIAICPTDGASFNQLFSSADNALYVRKNNGKNGFTFFNETSISCPNK